MDRVDTAARSRLKSGKQDQFGQPTDVARRVDGSDPAADLVAMWMALEVFYDRKTMDPESWQFLSETLQRPIEEKLMDTKPQSSEGAIRVLNMVMHLLTHVQPSASDRSSAQWYDQLIYRMIKNARDGVRRSFHESESHQQAGAEL